MSEEYKVIQIMPVNDIWLRYKEEDGSYFYDKAVCMALFEFYVGRIGMCQGICYLCKADTENLEAGIVHNTEDIFFTHELPTDVYAKLMQPRIV